VVSDPMGPSASPTRVVIPERSAESLSVVALTDVRLTSKSFHSPSCLLMISSTFQVVGSSSVLLALVAKLVSKDLVLPSRASTFEDRREETVVISVDFP